MMSKSDPHPAIRHQAKIDGHSPSADIDHNTFCTVQQIKGVLHSPQSRMDATNQIDAQISREDGGSLRQRSQLVDLRRRLSYTHEALLKAGR
jgi:hypothetical protein